MAATSADALAHSSDPRRAAAYPSQRTIGWGGYFAYLGSERARPHSKNRDPVSETISRPSAHVSQRLSSIGDQPPSGPISLERAAVADPTGRTAERGGSEGDAVSGLRRAGFLIAGVLFTVLAVVGVVLPLVPTTPFLLLAAACFARSSPRLYSWLLSNRTFGPYIRQWRRDRTIPQAAKHRAYFVIVLVFATSIALVGAPWPRALLVVLGLALLVFLARLPTTEPRA
jgi:uncharacterized membrane protein YbaN (DUF454 family)